ncbi:hypothetical protein CBL_08264 [Carabus blaptoides fortunei]
MAVSHNKYRTSLSHSRPTAQCLNSPCFHSTILRENITSHQITNSNFRGFSRSAALGPPRFATMAATPLVAGSQSQSGTTVTALGSERDVIKAIVNEPGACVIRLKVELRLE